MVEQTIALSNAVSRISRAIESLERMLSLDVQLRSHMEHECANLARISHQYLVRNETPSNSSIGTLKSIPSPNGKPKQILKDLHADLQNLIDVLNILRRCH